MATGTPWSREEVEACVADYLRMLTLELNGQVMQRGSSADMVHTVAELVSFSSRLMTLNPGDVILTGTPSGVGATTGTFLKPGDSMVATVEGLGSLTTPVVSP